MSELHAARGPEALRRELIQDAATKAETAIKALLTRQQSDEYDRYIGRPVVNDPNEAQ